MARPSRRRAPRALAVASLLALTLLGLTACSSSGGAVAVTPAPSSSLVTFSDVQVSTDLTRRPTFLIGDSVQSTSAFTTYDVVVGTGPVARSTDKVTVQYVARSAKTKRQFDSSWDRGKPYQFVPADLTFTAFAQGVPGMRVGGRRLVIIPAAAAFGASPPAGSGLGPNETLVFVIDLVSIP